jgi:PAS domain S-box-containing protein
MSERTGSGKRPRSRSTAPAGELQAHAVRPSEELYRTLFESAHDAILILEPADERVLVANPAAMRMYGFDEQELVGRSMLELSTNAEVGRQKADEALRSSERVQFETVQRRRDGTELIVDIRASVVEYDGRAVLLSINRDVTERRLADERLRESEERFRLIAEVANDVLWDWDLRGNWIWFSSGFTSEFGHPRDERGGTILEVWESLIHPEDGDRVAASMRDGLESTATEWADEYRFRRADGTYALVRDAAYIVRDATGRAIRFVGAMTDLTEERRLAEQLERAQRVNSLGRVAASIAHEFNNVLMGIQPHIEVMKRRNDPATVATAIEHIGKSVRRGKQVTDDILQFTRAVKPTLTDVNIGELLERWRVDVAPLLGAGIALELDTGAVRNVLIKGDPIKLAQVMTNLAVNAREAMPSGGRLRIAPRLVTETDQRVLIEVSDNGCGMLPEQLARAFDPLYTTRKGSAGLGLPLSLQIIAAHGGELAAESTPGAGTTFRINLPVLKKAAPIVANHEEHHPELRRVLLVEDEIAVATGLQWLLETEGISVDMVHTGGEAIGQIERRKPDVVILDVGLPDIDGTQVFAAIRKRWPDLPVLFSSGHAGAEALEGLLDTTRTRFLLKPYELPSLRAALREVLES